MFCKVSRLLQSFLAESSHVVTSEGHVCHVDEGSGSPTPVDRLDGWVKLQLLDCCARILELVLAMDMKLIGWHVLSSQT